MLCVAQCSLSRTLQTWMEEEGEHTNQPGNPKHPGARRPGHLTRLCPLQAKQLASQYWGSSRPAAVRRDPSLPYLEQYRIDTNQFQELFASLTPWACGSHTSVLAGRMFRLLDENKDSLINFKEFVTGISEWLQGLQGPFRAHALSEEASRCQPWPVFPLQRAEGSLEPLTLDKGSAVFPLEIHGGPMGALPPLPSLSPLLEAGSAGPREGASQRPGAHPQGPLQERVRW